MNNGDPCSTKSSTTPSASDLNTHFIQVCKKSLNLWTSPSVISNPNQSAALASVVDLDVPPVFSQGCTALIQCLKLK